MVGFFMPRNKTGPIYARSLLIVLVAEILSLNYILVSKNSGRFID